MTHRPPAAIRTRLLPALLLAAVAVGCADQQKVAEPVERRPNLELDAEESVARFKEKDPTLQQFFETAHSYAVFPNVTKGAAGIGAARGMGVVYQDDEPVGYAVLSQGTVGLQLGGQVYQELIFFQDRHALHNFKRGELEFSAQTSAVATIAGVSNDVDYESGVAIFTMSKGGLMFEASIGGQSFRFIPIAGTEPAAPAGPTDGGGAADVPTADLEIPSDVADGSGDAQAENTDEQNSDDSQNSGDSVAE